MIKRMTLIVRRRDMSKADFHAHWEKVHGPLVARMPGVIRYIQHHFDGEIPAYIAEAPELVVDGIAEIWFDTLENATLSMATADAAQRAAMEDGFLMSQRSKTYIVRQTEFDIPGTGSGE